MPSVVVRLPVITKVAPQVKPAQSTLTIDEALQRRSFNQQLPIFQLCPDILEYLFLLAAELESDIYDLHRAIITWSHTCHYWRTVAHSVKALWAMLIDFDDRSHRWNEEMLRLSHPLPIELSYRDDLSRAMQTLALQLSHLNRIQRYSVTCRDTQWDTLVEMLERPAPSLHTFHITCHRSFGSTRPAFPLISSNLFAGHAPSFRRLIMKECFIDFRSPLLTSLVSLRVTDLNHDYALSAAEWLAHLRQIPFLQELMLENAILASQYRPRPPSVIWHPVDPNQLPHIVKLVVDAPTPEISTLLRYLPMPKSHHWTVTCHDSSPGPHLDAILQTFCDGLLSSCSSNVHCPLLIVANDYDIYLRNGLLTDERSSEAYLSFTFQTATHQLWDGLFLSIANGLRDAISSVTILELILPTVHPSLLALLRRAERLNTLARLSAKMSKNLLPELQNPASVSLSDTGIFLPMLDRIVFTDDRTMWGESYRCFIAFLKWRLEVGAPIRTVYFFRCCILESVLKEIRSLGVEVEGDMTGFRWQNF